MGMLYFRLCAVKSIIFSSSADGAYRGDFGATTTTVLCLLPGRIFILVVGAVSVVVLRRHDREMRDACVD